MDEAWVDANGSPDPASSRAGEEKVIAIVHRMVTHLGHASVGKIFFCSQVASCDQSIKVARKANRMSSLSLAHGSPKFWSAWGP